MPTLVDTSVLLRLRDPASPAHAACRAALDPAQIARHGICLCAQVLIEYWVVATRPAERNGFGLTPAEAAGDLASLLGMLPCLDEPPDIAKRWLARVANYQVAGKPAHDARLVAWMEAHGIRRLLTLNPSDFVRYPDVEVVLPSVLLTAGPT